MKKNSTKTDIMISNNYIVIELKFTFYMKYCYFYL